MDDTTYEVHVVGRVSPEVLRELGKVGVIEQGTRTLVTGSFRDQAELHGFLQRLRAYGLELLELRTAPIGDSPDEDPRIEDLP